MKYYNPAVFLESQSSDDTASNRSLQALQRNLRRVNLGAIWKNKSANDKELPEISIENPEDKLVVERNAITVKLIEEIWKYFDIKADIVLDLF